ncbi:Clr5 domain-containing protein [Aspergillus lucknowensis]|uniref:Clr5 domain-containing protein n=1 Tax=Aspergillus lucknowensis TaxID=176173 RepID=A0ABR4LNB2_9EURO
MVYDWDGKREICYQMYIRDRKALEEIMEYMKNVYQFSPSKRAFQTQFKRWGFPSKQNPAHKNVQLVARVKQLWEINTSQRDMLRILNEEGFQIKERELMRVRAKNRWLLRVPNGMKAQQAALSPAQPPEDDGLLALQQEVYKNPEPYTEAETLSSQTTEPRPSPAVLSVEAAAKRKERLEQLKAESAERWASRKRRRRTRGWAGLPADPPGPPRFPSETTIDESKKYLNLDNVAYRQVRDHFQQICEKAGFIKKTIAGPEKWQEAKNHLIQTSEHLQRVFWEDPSQLEAKSLALDIVCTDVTKRMRTLERRMTIAEAKNTLGINPEESRQIRNAFYNTLKQDHFTSKLEAGDEHWKELKEQWIRGSELLQRILASGPADPAHASKLKALEVLCRDVMKRLRDDQTKRDPSRRRHAPSTNTRVPDSRDTDTIGPFDSDIPNGISTLASQALASAPITSGDLSDMQIDPSLLEAANDTSFTTPSNHPGNAFEYVDPMLDSTVMPVSVYFRVNSESELHAETKPWVEKWTPKSVTELRQLVSAKFPGSVVAKLEAFGADTNENDAAFVINNDHELSGYLSHLQGRNASFLVYLRRE